MSAQGYNRKQWVAEYTRSHKAVDNKRNTHTKAELLDCYKA
jgi:hypothetical protein